MKRSFVFLGLCLAISAGLAIAQDAKSASKAAASICCDTNTTRCSWQGGWTYGPRVSDFSECWDF